MGPRRRRGRLRSHPRRASVTFGCALALAGCVATAAGSGAPVPRSTLPVLPAMRALPPPRDAVRRFAYGWPLRPFDRQHAIRGGFGDPRFGVEQRNFHFGVDMPAAAWAPVYAVAPGTVYLGPDRVDVLSHVRRGTPDGFSYWHIRAAVREHSFVRRHALLGWVKPYWDHLHFSEILHGRWVNPLRQGALTPYNDSIPPRIEAVRVLRGPGPQISVIVDAFAVPPIRPPRPFREARLAPTLIRWRLLAGGRAASPWRVAVDFRDFIPPDRLFDDVYAPDTKANARGRPGRYLFYLARNWSPTGLGKGRRVVEVQVFGDRGAVAGSRAELAAVR